MMQCPLTELASVQAILDKVASCAHETRPAGSLVAAGTSLFENSSPPKELLDKIIPGRPVILMGADGHSGWANSRALAEVGIDTKTPNPENGIIEHNPKTGEPSGALRETAIDLVMDKVPEPTDAIRIEGLRRGLRAANATGITSFIEAAAGEHEFMAFSALAKSGELTAKTRLSLTYGMFGSDQFETLLAHRKEIRAATRCEAIRSSSTACSGETAALWPLSHASGFEGQPDDARGCATPQ